MKPKEWEKKRANVRHYNLIARSYHRLYDEEQNTKIKLILEKLKVKKSDRILDVGCGPVYIYNYIKDANNILVGIDLSLNILRISRSMKRQNDINKIIFSPFLILADSDYLPFLNNFFDKVFAITVLQNIPNPHQTLNEIIRVAKKNSTIVITSPKKYISKKTFRERLEQTGYSILETIFEKKSKDMIILCTKR